MAVNGAPASLATIAARVDARLEDLLQGERERWAAFEPDLALPLDEIRRLVLSGGKRLRPAFCYWGFVGAGGDGGDRCVVDAGAAFELMHAFALFHDDVMDDAGTRRGAPTTHAAFSAEHGRAAWAGESRRFGEGVAILVGDLAFVYSDELMAAAVAGRRSTGDPQAAWALWNELRIELNIGQYLDILGSVRRERRLAPAERIARYKSGKYTIERPLQLGALLARPDGGDGLLVALSRYGLPLGDAFQMRDDVMGAFGDSTVTGKPVGDDLREGKPTPLIARAVALASAAQRAVLDRVGTADLDADAIREIQEVIVETGALAALEGRIAELADRAIAALAEVDLTEGARDELAALARFVTGREV
jgi:geranylgeranyl diphosphate synthase type I